MADADIRLGELPFQPAARGTKRCRKCREIKLFSAFGQDKAQESGLRAECKRCVNIRRMARYHASETQRAEHADQARKQNYGLIASEFAAMLSAQAGLCKVCGDSLGAGRGQMHVDHCHGSKRVRGLLCRCCNIAIGHAKDSPARLRLMAEYIERDLAEQNRVPLLAAE